MRRIALVCLLGACGGSDGGPTGPISARITHYDYTFDIDSRASHAVLTAEVDVGGDCLTLPFRAQGLVAEEMKIDGKPMTKVTPSADRVELCGTGYEAGTTIAIESGQTIALETLAPTQVGYSVRKSGADTFYYLVSWINGCDQFAPCDSAPDKFASYTFHVTHPAGFTARCPGTITEVSPTETTCDTGFDGPTYSTFGVAVSDAWTQSSSGPWGSVEVTLYDRSTGTNVAKIDPVFHQGFVTFMEQQFGTFPYGDELRLLFAPTYWGGFEHPGNIVIDDSIPSSASGSYANPFAETVDHEITHQWAGDRVTIASTYDFFWKEATAEYMPFVYLDTVDTAAAAKTPSVWKNGARAAGYFLVPGDMPELVDYYGDVYDPGPMILYRQLEALTSRAQVLDGLKAALAMPGARSADDMVAALSTSTGLDLSAYAAAWIHGSGVPEWPEATITFTPAAGTSSLHVQLTRAPERRCKFHVSLQGANPGERVDVAVDTLRDGADQTLSVATPAFTVAMTVLDPDNECLIYPTGTFSKPLPPSPRPWLAGRDAPMAY